MNPQTIAILDFGGQYVQLIARRVRENHVHGIIVPPPISPDDLRRQNVMGLIFSGGPSSVYAPNAPSCNPELLSMGLPVLGICYGMQLVCQLLGADVRGGGSREFGRTEMRIFQKDVLFARVPEQSSVWMSHGDVVTSAPDDFLALAGTRDCPIAAVKHRTLPIYGVQFHPEVGHTLCGNDVFRNFLYEICSCTGDWRLGTVIHDAVESICERVGKTGQVICALSGGVDSSVTAALLQQAVGDRLTCIFVDNGLMRTGEAQMVDNTFRRHFNMDLRVVDAKRRFLSVLQGVTDPDRKRQIIGHEFIEVFKDEAKTIPNAGFLAQGTLYPDVIESGHGTTGTTARIKRHHNVGGLPAELGFQLVEPLRDLFKDEVRRIGEHLGLPEEIVWRHPFPGPGLAVRILGEVTADRLALLRKADDIILEEIRAVGWYRKISQAFGVLIPIQTTGVMGDAASYDNQYIAAVRCVETSDFMTADWVHLDPVLLGRIANRIANEVRGINRIVYDISSKPPSTIEWE